MDEKEEEEVYVHELRDLMNIIKIDVHVQIDYET